jgi:hypothetical protein
VGRSVAAYSADHSGLLAALKVADPCAHCLTYRADDSALHYLAVAHCLADQADDSVAHWMAVQHSGEGCPAGYFVERYFAERCSAAAPGDSRSGAAPGDSHYPAAAW